MNAKDIVEYTAVKIYGGFGTSNPSEYKIFAIWYCKHFPSHWKDNFSWRNTLLSVSITGWSCSCYINLFSTKRKLVSLVVRAAFVSLLSHITFLFKGINAEVETKAKDRSGIFGLLIPAFSR